MIFTFRLKTWGSNSKNRPRGDKMLLTRDLGRTDRQTETKMDGWTAHYKSPAERGPNK